jgi:hypothetical protein
MFDGDIKTEDLPAFPGYDISIANILTRHPHFSTP